MLFPPPSFPAINGFKNSALDNPFSLKIGESMNISDHGIIIKFIDVIEDSRCPSDVVCFWEGTVALVVNIHFGVTNLGQSTLNKTNLHKISFMGYYIKYIDLKPYPISTEAIHKSNYNATFVVKQYGIDWNIIRKTLDRNEKLTSN